MRWLLLIAGLVSSIEAKCVIRGACGDDPAIPCVVEGAYENPKKLPDEAFKTLSTYCKDFTDGQELCCDEFQAANMTMKFNAMYAITSSCPSCFFNLARVFCQMTCSPIQDEFLLVTGSQKAHLKRPEGTMEVTSMSYYLKKEYAENAYNSCLEVQNAQSGLALELLCGNFGITNCSPENLLRYMGTAPFPSPFQINFKFEKDRENITLMNFNSTKCSEPAYPGTLPCSCGGCSESCPPFPLPEKEPKPCVVGLDLFTFIAILLFILIASTFASVIILMKLKRRPTQEEDVIVNETDTRTREDSFLARIFEAIGIFCASHPWPVTAAGIIICVICSLGNLSFQVVTDPVELWSAPTNVARLQRNYFNTHLAPFYRVEQVIIKNVGGQRFTYESNSTGKTYEFGPVFDFDFVEEVFKLQENITNLRALHNADLVALQDICFSPLDQKCAIQSLPNWFQNDIENLESNKEKYLDHVVDCINSPTLTTTQDNNLGIGCLGDYGGPSFSYVALGGYQSDPKLADALILTFLVNNSVIATENERAEAWERVFISFMKTYSHPNMSVAFMGEVSVNDELMLQSKSDILVVLISYLLMFVYISLALGRFQSLSSFFVHSQVFLGAVGVILVLLSVVSSIGIYSFLGVPSTLIIFEVIPFLVLAVGVDNMFILVQAVQRTPRENDESIEEHIARVLGVVGPSMLMASASECTCFFLGSMITMPAIRAFALYAGMALLVDFLLQITVFVSLLTIDTRRKESKRLDLFCCFSASYESDEPSDSYLHRFMRDCFSPLLRKKYYRHGILFIFLSWMCLSLAVVNKLELGLDQKLSMPSNSYMQNYFTSIARDLNVGPPVYFVVEDKFNYSVNENQDLLGSFIGSNSYSLVNDVKQASKSPEATYISARSMSWIDDYMAWSKICCFEDENTHEICESGSSETCVPCVPDEETRPEVFTRHIRDFLKQNPDENCPVAGHAAYSTAVETRADGYVGASSFMSYHKVLRNNADFINALWAGRYVAETIQSFLRANYSGPIEEVNVFPYSIFYVYYEQYLTIWHDTLTQLALSFSGVIVITFIFMKFQVVPSLSICFTIMLIVLDLMGVMYFLDIQLNAVSLVNLVMSVGISVEFCSHIARAFAECLDESPVERAITALSTTGSSVLSGITLTKFAGVFVLAFAESQLFVVFYFKMYMAIVLIGSVHGLVFLPVLLATLGKGKNNS